MTAVRLTANAPHEISAFVDAVEAFAHGLPERTPHEFERDGDAFDLRIKAPTAAHRVLALSLDGGELEYSLGEVWTDQIDPKTADLNQLLATLDAVRDGRVREARDRRNGVIYHLYRLDSRGLRTWLRDGQYSLWHWLRLKIRRVDVHTLPQFVPGKA